MSSTRDWMRGGGDIEPPTPTGPTLAGIVIWALGLIIVVNLALVAARLLG